jgi:iron complex outermembrane receptor protein
VGLVVATLAFTASPRALAADNEVEELFVTARKREESLLEVPFSISALSEQTLRSHGASNLEELSRTVANFSVQNLGPGQSQIAIRGISAGQTVRDQPGVKEQVGVYLDESVVSLSLFTPDLDLFDLDRVEVLRGPQGTLFGSGSLSGTVRYITRQPTLGAFSGALETTLNQAQGGGVGGDLKAVVNLPISEQAALRITGFATRFPGFMDAVHPDGSVHRDVNDGTRRGFRAALLFKPTESLTITPRVQLQKIEVDGFNRVDLFNILGNPYTTTREPVALGGSRQYTQLKEKFTDRFLLADLTVQLDLDQLRLTSISSYTERSVLVLRDATALTASILGGSLGLAPAVYTLDGPLADTTEVSSYTQEIRLASRGGGRFQWVVGGFYADVNRDYAQTLMVAGFSAATGIATQGVAAPTDAVYFSTVPYQQQQYALFGEASYAVTDRLTATAGLRFADYQENRTLTFDGIFADTTIAVPGKTQAEHLAPRLMVAFAATADVTLNAQVSSGFRLGGINDPLNRPLCTPGDFATFGAIATPSFKHETVWNYEAGLKTRLGGRGMLSVAGFYADISHLQATIDAGSCSSRIIANVPSAKATGFDVEFSYRLSESFEVATTASYNDAKLTSSLRDVAGTPLQGLREGNRLPTVPKLQASLSLGYERAVTADTDLFSNFVWQYVGKRFTQIADQENDPATVNLFRNVGATTVAQLFVPLSLPAYAMANLRVGVRRKDWELAAFVNNLGDEHARLAIDRERGLRARYGFLTNPPRTYGVSVRKSFQ